MRGRAKAPFRGPRLRPGKTARAGALGLRPERPVAVVEPNADSTWRLCTRGITPSEAAGRARTRGPERYTDPALRVLCIIR